MRILCFAGLVFSFLTLAISNCANADTAAVQSARSAIQADYDKSNAAAAKSDCDGMLGNCDPSFIIITIDGTKKPLDSIRDKLSMDLQLVSLSNAAKIQSILVQGNTAVVHIRERVAVTSSMTHPQVTIIFTNQCQDFWVSIDGVWTEKRSRMISSTRNDGLDGDTSAHFHW